MTAVQKNPSIFSNNNYTFTTLRHYRMGQLNYLYAYVTVTSASPSNFVNIAKLSTASITGPQITVNSFDNNGAGTPLNFVVDPDGNIYARGGYAGSRYQIVLTFI